MICHKCGYENKGGDKICFKCDALLDYHEIVADKIDVSGLALAEEEDVAVEVESSRGRGVMAVIAGVIVIIAIVAVVFVPQYLAQARAENILALISVARSGVEAHVKEHRVWPTSEYDLSPTIPEQLKVDVDLVIKKGVIEFSIVEEPGKTAIIRPMIKQGRFTWKCENGGIGPEYLPLGCFQ